MPHNLRLEFLLLLDRVIKFKSIFKIYIRSTLGIKNTVRNLTIQTFLKILFRCLFPIYIEAPIMHCIFALRTMYEYSLFCNSNFFSCLLFHRRCRQIMNLAKDNRRQSSFHCKKNIATAYIKDNAYTYIQFQNTIPD